MKVLIVGESHYDSGDNTVDDENFTRASCQYWVDVKPPPFVEHVVAAVTGSPNPSDRECGEFWKTIAFYNYVRHLADRGKGASLKDLAEPEAVGAFREVLRELEPACVLMFSKGAGRDMPTSFDRDDAEAVRYIGYDEKYLGWFKTGDGPSELALTIALNHPSYWDRTGGSADQYHPFIQKTLDYARQSRHRARA